MNQKIIIKGSSNRNGNTQKIIDYLNTNNDFDVVDLLDYNIGHFDYNFKNSEDDFIPLMEKIIQRYDTIIFATPVYWYSMSGILKVFFDRISDLLHYKKDLGRQLRGKSMGMISNSNDNDCFSFFNKPFVESAKYLGMNYLGDIHTWFDGTKIHDDANKIIDTFKNQILTH